MLLLRRPITAVLAAAAVLAAGAPAASASTARLLTSADGACSASSTDYQGANGGIQVQSCGLSFTGPMSQVSTVTSPPITTGSFVGSSIVAGGNVAIGA
jgi:hypothetical protein